MFPGFLLWVLAVGQTKQSDDMALGSGTWVFFKLFSDIL